jgi:hypothetical protein
MLSWLMKLHRTSFQTDPVRLVGQFTRACIHLHPSAVQQVPILCSIEEVLGSKHDATVSFRVESDLKMVSRVTGEVMETHTGTSSERVK